MRRVVTAALAAGLILPMVVTSTATADDPPPTTGTITGFVLDGRNDPIDATVILRDVGDDLQPIQVQTEANGGFTFTDVPFGEYRLRTEADGYGELWWPGTRSSGAAGTLSVSSEEPTLQRDLTFGAGRITGTVVAPSTDGPVALPGWTITARSWAEYEGDDMIDIPPGTTSDEDGHFAIGGLEDDTWVLQLRSPDGVWSWYGGTSFWDAEQFQISSGEELTEYDVTIEIATGGVEGNVTVNGEPLERGRANVRSGNTTVRHVNITDGSYSVPNLADGTYWLDIRWSTDDEMDELQYGSATRTPFVVADGAVTTFDVDVTTIELTGTVTHDPATTTLFSVRAEQDVVVDDDDEWWTETTERYGTVAGDGTFSIDGLDVGEWRVAVSFQHGEWWFGSPTGRRDDTTPVTITVDDHGDGPVTSITVDGEPVDPASGLAIDLPTGSIFGTVELPSYANGEVRIRGVESQFQRHVSVWNEDEAGTVEWTAPVIPDGEYLVTAEDWDSGATFEHPGTVVVENGASVGPIDLVPPVGRISGTVTWDPDTVNVHSVTAYSFDPDEEWIDGGTRSASIGEGGSFNITGLPAGEWRVRANFQGGQWWFGSPSGRSGDATLVTVTITDDGDGPVSTMSIAGDPIETLLVEIPTGAITGTIDLPDSGDDPYGEGPDTTIEVIGISNDVSRWRGTSGSSWTVGALPDGEYRIIVHLDGGGNFEHPETVWVTDGGTTGPIALVPPAGSISGTIELPDGLGPWGDAPWIRARLTDDSFERSIWLWDAEPFGVTPWTITTLPDGDYTVTASLDGVGQVTHPDTITIADGVASSTVDLVLALPDGEITGVVRSGDTPLEGATLTAHSTSWDTELHSRSTTSEADGEFTITGLADGEYRIQVVTDDGEWWFGSAVGSQWDASRVTLVTTDDGDGTVSTMFVGGQPVASLAIDLPAGSIFGTVTLPAGLEDSWADITITDADERFSRYSSVDDGSWSVGLLPDGTYRVEANIDGVGQITHPDPVVVSGGQATGPIDITVAGGGIDGVVTRSGNPVPWTQVRAVDTATIGGEWDGNEYYAQANGQGQFSLRGLPDGDYHLRVETWSYQWWHGPTGALDDDTIVLTVAGGVTSGVEIELPDLTVTGTLSFRDQPLAYHRIDLEGDSVWESTYTDGDGWFEFDGLPPGDYTLTAWSDAGLVARYPAPDGTPEPRFTLTLDVPVVDIDLVVPPGSIVGRILRDGEPFGPVPGSDHDDGWYNGRLVTVTRLVADGAQAWTTGRPLAADGAFRIDGIFPGSYLITAIDEYGNTTAVGLDDLSTFEPVVVGPDDLDVDVGTIDLPPNGTATGTVADPVGVPADDVRVRAFNDQFGTSRSASTDENGSYVMEGLRSGTYRFYVEDDTGGVYHQYWAPGTGNWQLAGEYEVTSGSTIEVDIEVPRRAAVTGRVTDAEPVPAPIAGATVSAYADWQGNGFEMGQ